MIVINKDRATLYLQKIEIISMAGLLFILPFTGMTTIREIFFFMLVGTFAAEKLLDYKNIQSISLQNKSLHILILLSFVWAAIALVNAIDLRYSFNEIVTKMSKQYLLYFLAFFIVQEISFEKVEWLFSSLVFSAVIMSVFACYQFYQSPLFFENRVQSLTGAFYRLSTFLVLSIPLVTVLAFNFHGWAKRISLVIIPFLFAALFFTFTRGAWLAVVVEISILIAIFLKKYRQLFLLSIVAVFLIIIGLSYKSVISSKLIIHGSEQPRIEAIKLSSEIIRKYPLTGIGYGKETFSKYYPNIYVKHSHNIFINTAIETGLIGLLIFSAMLGIVLKNFTRAIKKETTLEKRLIFAGIFASFIGFLCLNIFDYMYHGWPGQMFWMLIGIGNGLLKYGPEADIVS